MSNSIVALDARDAFIAPLRGWGRYALELTRNLPSGLIQVYRQPVRGPEVLWEQISLPARLRRDRVSAVHAPNCFLPLRRPCPGVVTIHDLAFEVYPGDFSRKTGMKYRFFTPRAARSAERIICVSQYTADDVCARYGVDPAKVRVVPNAPSLPIGDLPVPHNDPYLLAVGDVRAKKNLERLIAAWQQLDSGHRLVLAGHGDMRVPEGVSITGFLPDAELDALMRGAALLVHPSLYEGFGLVIAEAMARGVPVACADATALPETAGDAAELFDPLDVDEIAAAIVRALGRADELSALGRARAAGWSWQQTAAQTADVYRELIG
ncbi:MAG TPA: glycosyltransferase family 1 protein [Solirubrobacteraceae bacterium]